MRPISELCKAIQNEAGVLVDQLSAGSIDANSVSLSVEHMAELLDEIEEHLPGAADSAGEEADSGSDEDEDEDEDNSDED